MDLNDNLDKIKQKSKNVYIELDNEKYYAFLPQPEYFGLTQDDCKNIENCQTEYQKSRIREDERIKKHNDWVSRQNHEAESKMKTSNIVNAIITIILFIITFTCFQDGNTMIMIFLFLSFSFPFAMYFISEKVVYSDIPKRIEKNNISIYDFITKEKEQQYESYKRALKYYQIFTSGKERIFNLLYPPVNHSLSFIKHISLSYFKKYFSLLDKGFNIYAGEEENVYLAENKDEKVLIFINIMSNKQINLIRELAILESMRKEYNCTNAVGFINCKMCAYASDEDCENSVIWGYFDLSYNLNRALADAIFRLRCKYYEIDDETTILNHKCKKPYLSFYKDGNLKYYGDIDKVHDGTEYREKAVSSGYGILLDRELNILEIGNFYKGYIDIDTEDPIVNKKQVNLDKIVPNDNVIIMRNSDGSLTGLFKNNEKILNPDEIIKSYKKLRKGLSLIELSSILKANSSKKIELWSRFNIFDYKNNKIEKCVIIDKVDTPRSLHGRTGFAFGFQKANEFLGHSAGDIIENRYIIYKIL